MPLHNAKCVLFKCFVLFLSLSVLFAGGITASAETLEELRDRQSTLEAQKKENDEKLEALKNDTQQKKAYRDTLYEQIDTVQNQLDTLRRQISDLNNKIVLMEDEIAEKQASIQENVDLLKERIRALYVTGEASVVAIILDSRDILDFAEKAQILKAVTKHDQQLISLLNDKMKEIEVELEQINLSKEELSENQKDMEAKGAELTELYEEAEQLVSDAENEEWYATANSEILGSQMAENEDAILKLEEEIRQSGITGGEGYEGTGSFIWPIPGYTYLTCYYGDGGHRGIDVAGGDIYGKPIVAADGGYVTYAGWNDSYGYCVFIDHGNGYETRYAHMSELGISTGVPVEQGEIIGYVGSTGNSTGPHLHFEVIYGGSTTNPMGYF